MANSRFLAVFIFSCIIVLPLCAQVKTNEAYLKKAEQAQVAQEKTALSSLLSLSRQKGWKMMFRKNNEMAVLTGVDQFGYPLYVSTDNTLQVASTIGTNQLWAGGSLGLELSGGSANMAGKLGIWDGARVNTAHVELKGRVMQKDNPSFFEDHSTHVSGLMIGEGVNPLARGMAYGAQQLIAYDFNGHISEMLSEASNLLVSNHSYTSIAGWSFNSTDNRWEFWGRNGDNEDYKFGYYSYEAQSWDAMAYAAPYYLIVKAAGNSRTQTGPAVGQPYYRFDPVGIMTNAGNRPEGISSNNSYDAISTYGNSKNILTVGAIQPISGGYNQPSDAVIANFSSWGPTDDGRIKPDVVADGVNLLSASAAASNNDYTSLSGTSMASPSVAASVFLLQEYYSQLHSGQFMRSATLKGLVIHTASEAGTTAGPDYIFGWGLVNMPAAAEMIKSDNTEQQILENTLAEGQVYSLKVRASGKGPLVATICWTDPEAAVESDDVLNNRSPRLVNDLDIRIKKESSIYFPWKLNPLVPFAAATQGDNITDNVEKIEINDALPGEEYTIEISHKGGLVRIPQAYSLLISGVGGSPYCQPSLGIGARIPFVEIGSLSKTLVTCLAYQKFSDVIPVFNGEQVNVSLSLSDCSGPVTDKIVKIFIDYNQDGDFEDELETVITSSPVTSAYTGSFAISTAVKPGVSTVLRLAVKTTTDPSDVSSCDGSGSGEVQDYILLFTKPANDLSIAGLTSPDISICPSSQLVSIRIRNTGTEPQKDIPVSTVIKRSGFMTVATLNAVYPGTIAPGREVIYTYPQRFNALADNFYTISNTVNLGGDQNPSNNQQENTISVGNGSNAPAILRAAICSSKVELRAFDNESGQVFWYDSPNSLTPIASGRQTNSEVIAPEKIYYAAFNDAVSLVGPENKSISASGVYDDLTNNHIKFTAAVPFTIESARLYVGHPGKVKLTVGKVITASSHQVISSSTIDVYATDPSPEEGSQTGSNPADQGAIFQLNLAVPQAGDYILIIECLEGATLFYNNGITTNPYPFTIKDVVSITGNSAESASNPDFYQRFYVAIYDIGIRLNGCASNRVKVIATDCNESNTFQIRYGPNPGNGLFRLQFQLSINADLNIALYNSTGNQVYSIKYPSFSGSFNEQINLSHLSNGLYLIRITHGGNKYTRKLIIQK